MTVLHIDSSITGDQSVSRIVSQVIADRFAGEGGAIVRRDLVRDPLPHLTLEAMADSSVLEEFLAADTIVIGAPMYNFTLPTQLKAWIDRIMVAGRTFRYGANGPEGLAGGRRVIIALARGGFYAEGPAAGLEHTETYLRSVFSFIGIEPEFVVADGIAVGPEQRQSAIAKAVDHGQRLAA